MKIIEDDVTVELDENNKIKIRSHDYDKKVDFYIINLLTALQPETFYFIYIPFEATLDDGATGYYRSSYTDEKGNIRLLIYTLLITFCTYKLPTLNISLFCCIIAFT